MILRYEKFSPVFKAGKKYAFFHSFTINRAFIWYSSQGNQRNNYINSDLQFMRSILNVANTSTYTNYKLRAFLHKFCFKAPPEKYLCLSCSYLHLSISCWTLQRTSPTEYVRCSLTRNYGVFHTFCYVAMLLSCNLFLSLL